MAFHIAAGKSSIKGFTLIELLVVLAIIAAMLSIAAPRYFRAADDAREAALKANLHAIREAIDHYHGDMGVYPGTLAELVDRRYLRSIPIDPISESAETWKLLPLPDLPAEISLSTQVPEAITDTTGIYDVRSGADGVDRNGVPYENL